MCRSPLWGKDSLSMILASRSAPPAAKRSAVRQRRQAWRDGRRPTSERRNSLISWLTSAPADDGPELFRTCAFSGIPSFSNISFASSFDNRLVSHTAIDLPFSDVGGRIGAPSLCRAARESAASRRIELLVCDRCMARGSTAWSAFFGKRPLRRPAEKPASFDSVRSLAQPANLPHCIRSFPHPLRRMSDRGRAARRVEDGLRTRVFERLVRAGERNGAAPRAAAEAHARSGEAEAAPLRRWRRNRPARPRARTQRQGLRAQPPHAATRPRRSQAQSALRRKRAPAQRRGPHVPRAPWRPPRPPR